MLGAAGLGFAAALGGLLNMGYPIVAASFLGSAASWRRCFDGFAAAWGG